MNGFEQIKAENEKMASEMGQLAGTEETRLSVITAVFVRINNEMRLKNIQDVKQDISYGARDFGVEKTGVDVYLCWNADYGTISSEQDLYDYANNNEVGVQIRSKGLALMSVFWI